MNNNSDQTILVYGADWCPDCHRSRQYLDDNHIDYKYLDIDSDPLIKKEMLRIADGKNIIPTIVLPSGEILQEPNNQVLAQKLNYNHSHSDHKAIDLAIIGGGPAALTAALYATRENIETFVFEKAVIGGMAAVTDLIDNYPGFDEGVSGLELADKLEKQAVKFGTKIEFNSVQQIKLLANNDKELSTDNGDVIARAVLIATGTDYKKLNVPGEKEYLSRGVHYCATCDGAFYRDMEIAVVGGGNSAIQETIFLTKFASKIHLLIRSSMKASDALKRKLQPLIDSKKVEVYLETKTLAIEGDGKMVDRVIIEKNNQKSDLKIKGVFIFVGLKPNSDFLKDCGVELDQYNFVKTDDKLRTSLPGVFAAGDIRSGATMQIASAVGEGASAALSIRHFLES